MSSLPLQHVYAEPEVDTDGPDPAVIVMHGRGADEQDLLPVAQQLPDELAAVSLRAPDPVGGGYRWYEIDASEGLHTSQPYPEEYQQSLELASESIEAAIDQYDLDPDRIGLLGFSMGSMVGMGLMLESPTEYDWLVGLHGYLPESHADLAPADIAGKPIFLAGGEADRIIPISRVEAAAERFRELDADVTFNTYATGHGIGQAELADIVEFVQARLA
jgi:phospholipase/carboxylesterase